MKRMKIVVLLFSSIQVLLFSIDLTSVFLNFGSFDINTVDFSHGHVSISFGDILIPSVPALSFPPIFGILFRFNSSSIFKGTDDLHDITGFSLSFDSFTFSGYAMRSVGISKMEERGFGILINPPNDVMDISASIGLKERHESGDEKIDEMNMPWTISIGLNGMFVNLSNDSYTISYDVRPLPISITLRKSFVDTTWKITEDQRARISIHYSFSNGIKLILSAGMNGRFEVFGYPLNYGFDVRKDGMDLSVRSRNFEIHMKDMKPSILLRGEMNGISGILKISLNKNEIEFEGSMGCDVKMKNLSFKPTLRVKEDGFSFTTDFTLEW